ncbi:UDP-3-O-glucosamine N-acyltransferase [Trametopsis cervina]|nr:UDP-3-O-glucosamine N-acyltransferase [Trametopsis cervina]
MDFDESSTSRVLVQEFIAVVFAGFGNDLTPLTNNHGDEPCPKALLPIANKPMLHYPLSWLEASGIREVLLICPAVHRAAMNHYIRSDASTTAFPSLRIDLQVYGDTQDLNVGTGTVLRHFAHKIKHDFVVLPCDFVPSPSFLLTKVLDKFRTEASSDGSITTTCFFEWNKPEKGSSTEEWNSIPTPMPVVWDEPSGTLLYVDTADDVDRDDEHMELSMSLLSSYPKVRLSSNMIDSHVYVCQRSVLDVLQEKSRLDSIREEFIPWLCRPQYSRRKKAKYGSVLNPTSASSSQNLALKHATLHHNFSETSAHITSSENEIRTAPSSPVDSDDGADNKASLRVGIVIHSTSDGYAARANTLHSYLELNRHFLVQTSWTLPTDPESRALIDPKAQISTDSMVGHTTQVEERTSIKKSVIGKHCVIGKMVKIAGCVILDHCVIADGAKLDGCILGKNTKVGAKAELTRCVTQAGYEVDAGETFRNDKLEVADWTAAHESGDDDDDGSASSDESDS